MLLDTPINQCCTALQNTVSVSAQQLLMLPSTDSLKDLHSVACVVCATPVHMACARGLRRHGERIVWEEAA